MRRTVARSTPRARNPCSIAAPGPIPFTQSATGAGGASWGSVAVPAWKIDINVNTTQPPRASFAPNALQALPGDLITWANNDNHQSHWPAPVVDGVVDKTGWLSEAIPPNASSKESFSPPAAGTLSYCCALHPSEKSATIEVLGAPPTSPSPLDT
jgi:plastocyanin